jgi:uncharacterized protein (TIGR03435 family)
VKEGPVYALVVDKSGLKMKANESEQDFKIPISGDRTGVTTGKRVPLEYFCWWLSQGPLGREGRPVIDRTGLKGFYDFTLAFLPDLPPGFDMDKLPPGMADRPDLFTALREQLGLKLEAQKGPVDFYVIDSAEKPAAN